MLDFVILAAGKGSRMNSSLPKVLHTLGGSPLLSHVISAAENLTRRHLQLVVGHGQEKVREAFAHKDSLNFVEQTEQLGTGHAVQQALPHLREDSITVILYGDVPLIQAETLEALVAKVDPQSMALLTLDLEQPKGYGRIVRHCNGNVEAIVEEKDANSDEKAIKEVNTGIMAVNTSQLAQWLPQLANNNAQGEYYLTDIIAMAVAEGVVVNTHQAKDEWEVLGVNNRVQQAQLERIYQRNLAESLLNQGVSLLDPCRFDCRGTLTVGSDTCIDINCLFEGDVTLGNHVSIGANCVIKNTTIGDHTVIQPNSIIEDSELGESCNIGPYARLRPGTRLANKAKIGNFVETKKAVIGEGSKVNHLSYVGDAQVGKDVNIGAGTITCNYDGANKYQTTIKDKVFVGSNTALVAPVTLGEQATIAAGSTITKNVESEQLALTRSPQKAISGWQRPVKKSS